MYRRSKRLYGNSDGKLRDDRGDRDDRDRPVRTLLYPGDRDDRVKFTCDHMETVNRPDRQHTISSDRGHWGDRGDYMETRLNIDILRRECHLILENMNGSETYPLLQIHERTLQAKDRNLRGGYLKKT